MARDLICGMTVDEATSLSTEQDGKTYYFCGDSCLQKFRPASKHSNRDEIVRKGGEPAAGEVIFTGPMHPEVRQNHPGDCPKCGMALEAVTVVASLGDGAPPRSATLRGGSGSGLSSHCRCSSWRWFIWFLGWRGTTGWTVASRVGCNSRSPPSWSGGRAGHFSAVGGDPSRRTNGTCSR